MGEQEVALDLNAKLAKVTLSALSIVSLIQHSQESTEATFGHLIGLNLGDTVEVSSSYPLSAGTTGNQATFHEEVVAPLLGSAGFDRDLVGWYQKTDKGDCFDIQTIEYQHAHQKENSGFVMVVYNPLAVPCLRAYQLTDVFMELYSHADQTQPILNKLEINSTKVFTEVSLEQTSSTLEQAFLSQFQFPPQIQFSQDYVENQLGALEECVEELRDHEKTVYAHLKSVAESSGNESKTLRPPSRLDSLLLSSQINYFCDDLSSYVKEFSSFYSN